MKRGLSLLLAVLLIVTGLLAVTGIVLNAVLPEKIRVYAAKAISERTGRDTSIGTVSLNVFSGIVFRNVRITENGLPWMNLDRAKATYTLFSLFSGTPIDSLVLDSPSVYLRCRPDGSLNLQMPSVAGKNKRPLPIAIRKVTVRNGTIHYADLRSYPALRKSLRDIELSATLGEGATIFYRISAAMETGAGRITVNGRFHAPNELTIADIGLEKINYSDLQPFLNAPGVTQAVLDGKIHIEHTRNYLRLHPDMRFTSLQFSAGGTRGWAQGTLDANFYSGITGLQDYSGSMTLEQCEIALPGNTLSLAGPVEFTHKGLSWKTLNVGYAGKEYLSSGSVRDYANPSIELGIYAKDLKLEAQAQTQKKVVQIKRLKAELKSSQLFLQGSIDLSQLPAVPVQLEASCDAELSDLDQFLSGNAAWKEARASGRVKAELQMSGNIRDKKSMELSGKGKSEKLGLYGLIAGNANAEYRKSGDKAGAVFNFSFYEGTVNGNIDYSIAPGLPYTLQVSADGVQLEKFKMDTGLRERDLAGKISADGLFSGKLACVKDSSGHGQVSVVKGRLWQLDLLRGLHQTLLPELATVTFEKGYADFQVKDRDLLINNANLLSSLIQLTGKARIHSNNRVEGFIDIRVSDRILPNLGKLKQLASFILKQTGRIVGVKISGSRTDPKYTLQQPLLSGMLKKIDEIIRINQPCKKCSGA